MSLSDLIFKVYIFLFSTVYIKIVFCCLINYKDNCFFFVSIKLIVIIHFRVKMSVNNINTDNNGQEKSLPESTVHSVPQNLTTIQSVQNIQSIQNSVVTGSIPTIQTVSQAVTAPTPTIIGKSISLDLNSSKILMKPAITSNIVASDSNKIINTQVYYLFCKIFKIFVSLLIMILLMFYSLFLVLLLK